MLLPVRTVGVMGDFRTYAQGTLYPDEQEMPTDESIPAAGGSGAWCDAPGPNGWSRQGRV